MDETLLNDLSANWTDEQKQDLAKVIANLKGKDDLQFSEQDSFFAKDRERLNKFKQIWVNSGMRDNQFIEMEDLFAKDRELRAKYQKDAQYSQDIPLLLPRVVSEMARDAIEPTQVLTPLLTDITFQAGTSITFPAWSAMSAADIAEGGEYPEKSLDLAGQVTAKIGKSGVAFAVTEEMIRYSQYDVVSAHIRAAGRALARLKEQKTADLITTDYGNVIFDNDSGSVKSTTGRNAAGAYNGTLTLDDLFYAYAEMVNRGFPANTLIMHPFAWQIFAQEGIARAFGFENGMNPLMWQAAQGSPGNANPWRQGGLNQNRIVSSPENVATTFTNVPSIFPTNFRVVVSPYMPYDATTQKTDILFCDSAELGILVTDEQVTSDEWNDMARDIRKMKFRERYALAVQNDGQSIGLMKNIKIEKSFDFADKISLSVTPSDPLSGDDANTAAI